MNYPESQLAFVEDGLQLPRGAIMAMVGTDEWAMVLKLHAVIESTINMLISEADGVPVEVVARRRIGQTDSRDHGSNRSKAKQAFELKALSKITAPMLDALTSIRNEYAHSPRHALLPIRDVVMQSSYRDKIERLPVLPFMANDEREWRARFVVGANWVLGALVRALLKAEPEVDFDAKIAEAIKPDPSDDVPS